LYIPITQKATTRTRPARTARIVIAVVIIVVWLLVDRIDGERRNNALQSLFYRSSPSLPL
jgi:hypothetical protein